VGRKLLPLTVNVKEALPAAALVGDIEVTEGTGLGGLLMMKAIELESPLFPVPEAGLRVLTNAVPALAMSDADTVAVIPVTAPELSVLTCVGIVF